MHLASLVLAMTLGDANSALKLVEKDIATCDARYTRYVWIDDGDPLTAKAVAYTWNLVSRTSRLERPVPITDRQGTLVLRFDLKKFAPKQRDLIDHLELWESFQNDPKFSRFFTKDTLKFNDVIIPPAKRWVEQQCPEYVHTDGKKYTSKWGLESYKPTQADIVVVIRTISQVLNHELVKAVTEATGSDAPVVSADYFILRTLKSIRDDGLYKELYGGLYYDLVGFKRNVKGKTDLDGIFEQLGLQNADKVLEELDSDQKIAIFRSKVTGKPRAVNIFHTSSGRNGTGTVRISEDLRDSSIDIGTHPLMNLLKRKFNGQELIIERGNGLPGFAALNGDKKLVDEVPFDIALDSTIPSPHSRRLEAGLSCIICHGPHDGVQPLVNDVPKVAKRTNILGDQNGSNDRLAGLYSGDPKKLLYRVKDDYASAVLFVIGPWPGKETKDIVQDVSAHIGKIRQRYWYNLVTWVEVSKDLGIPATTLKEFQDHIKINLPREDGTPGLEDVRVAALLEGLGINRFEYDLIRDFLAERVKR